MGNETFYWDGLKCSAKNDLHYFKVRQCHATGGPKILFIILIFLSSTINNVAAEILNSASFIANISAW